jgi:hypothetical protein
MAEFPPLTPHWSLGLTGAVYPEKFGQFAKCDSLPVQLTLLMPALSSEL